MDPRRMEFSWSEKDLALPLFLKRYRLPQIVQIFDGIYGEDDETTLSQGQVLNLHLVKDMQFYSGYTDSGQEVHIPLNSPHRLCVYLNMKAIHYDIVDELYDLFPRKYKYIRLANSLKSPCDPTKTIDAEDILKALFFDKDAQSLICLDRGGCEVSIGLDMFDEVRPVERIDGVFMAEVYQRYSLPLSVQFTPQRSVRLERGMIHLKRIIVKQTVVASTRDTDYKSILTFPSNLDVTVLVPQGATANNTMYRDLCKHLNSEINLLKVEETIEKDTEIYDDVKSLAVKAIPYAETFFGKKKDSKPMEEVKKSNLTEGMDGYISFDESSEDSSDGNVYEVMDELPVSPSFRTLDRALPPKPSTEEKISSHLTSPTDSTNRTSGFFKKLSSVKMKKKDSSSGVVSAASSSSPDMLKSPTSPSYPFHEEDDYGDDEEEYDYPYVESLRRQVIRPGDVGRHYYEPQQTVIKADRKIDDLTIQEVGMLLHDLNLGQYGGLFEREQIDGRMLKDLDKEMLQSHFHMIPFHAHKLIKVIKENWRPVVKE